MAMAKAKQNWWAFGLELLGSILMIGTWWNLGQTNYLSSAFIGAGTFWVPIFIGFGVIASVALLFISFVNVSLTGDMNERKMMNWMASKASVVAGVTLSVWAWGITTWTWTAIMGFVLGFIGAWLGSKG